MKDWLIHFPAQIEGQPSHLCFWCPGCNQAHCVPFVNAPQPYPDKWAYDGNQFEPTLSPSIRTVNCHVVVTKGVLNYQSDCKHSLAGKSVPMEPWDYL